jgi:hypothetical protein
MKTKNLSIANVNFEDAEEMARFRQERDSLYAERKSAIVADFKRNGDLDEQGQWVFEKPLPEDMQPDSPADFKH